MSCAGLSLAPKNEDAEVYGEHPHSLAAQSRTIPIPTMPQARADAGLSSRPQRSRPRPVTTWRTPNARITPSDRRDRAVVRPVDEVAEQSERQAHPTEDAHGPGTECLDRGRERTAGEDGMEGQPEEQREDDHEHRAALPPWDTGRLKDLARPRPSACHSVTTLAIGLVNDF